MNAFLCFAVADSSFVRLFSEMNPWTVVLFVLGVLFCVVELFTPGFGFFGTGGIVMLVAAVVLRLIFGGDALMLIYMIVIVGALLVLLFVVFDKIVKKGSFRKNSIFDSQPSVSEQKTEGTADYSSLLNSCGVTTTALRPVGKAKFGNLVVDVVSCDGFVAEGEWVVVKQIDGPTVTVAKGENND